MSDDVALVPPGARLLGREWLGFDETGEVGLVGFEALSSFTNRHGTIQGGFLAAMLDSATGVHALAALPSNRTAVTISLSTRFLKPASVGKFTAKTHVVEQSEREIMVAAELVDSNGTTVAVADAQLRILNKR